MSSLRKHLFLFFLLSSPFFLYAGEGMWLFSQLKNNLEKMKNMGCNLSEEDIYHIKKSSIKDAIVGLGRENKPFYHFCTAGIVSSSGLLLTNHHCAFSLLQSHSTNKNNLLKNGFWASSKKEELTNPGITASILVRMEEVTNDVLEGISEDMTDSKRQNHIEDNIRRLESNTKKDNYCVKIKSMFNGNKYFLFVHKIYKDVRLVAAPSQHIGKFGGNTDNWEWPRHTADFALLRIYTAPDGKPATYHPKNIPLKSEKYLSVSLKGYKENDFTMVLGFPGNTNRFITSYGLDYVTNIINKNRYHIRSKKLEVLAKEMQNSEEVKIKYAAKYDRCANYWKYSNTHNKALNKLKIKEKKTKEEELFTQWIEKNEKRKKKYGQILEGIRDFYKRNYERNNVNYYIKEALYNGPDLFSFAIKAKKLEAYLGMSNNKKKDSEITSLRKKAEKFYKNFDTQTEIKLIAVLFEDFAKNIPQHLHPTFFQKLKNNNYEKFAEKLVNNSIFSYPEKLNKFLANPTLKQLNKDETYQISKEIYRNVKNFRKSNEHLNNLKRLYTEGLLTMHKGRNFTPDANSTLRFNYAKVKGYSPKDAVQYKHYTTLNGVFEKMDNTQKEFCVDEKLNQLFVNKKYGKYTNKAGELPCCFITDSDITGGNSGSPVLNNEGHLIGIAFDGNSESMSGDIDFEENLQRCINVDIRYVLWIIEHYAKATRLIDELKIGRASCRERVCMFV